MDLNFELFDPCYGDSTRLPNKPCVYLIVLREGHTIPNHKNVAPILNSFDFRDEHLSVLYVGKSKTKLCGRDYNNHFTCSASENSSLRKSIGCLLGYDLVDLAKRKRFKVKDENRITEWMKLNLYLLYSVNSEDVDIEEKDLIQQYNPPLNLRGNSNDVNKVFRNNLLEQRKFVDVKKAKASIDKNGMIVCPNCKTHLIVTEDTRNDEQIQCSNCKTIFNNPIIHTKGNRKTNKRRKNENIISKIVGLLFYGFILFGVSYCTFDLFTSKHEGMVKVDGKTRYVITKDYIASPNESSAIQSEERMKKAARGDYGSMDDGYVNYGAPVHLFRGDVVVVVDVNHKYGYKVIRLSDYQQAIVDSPKLLKKLDE